MTKTAVQKVCDMRDEGKDVTRFWYINPHETNKMLEDLYIVRKQYTSQSLSYVPPARFISEDEIDNIFRGGTDTEYITTLQNIPTNKRESHFSKKNMAREVAITESEMRTTMEKVFVSAEVSLEILLPKFISSGTKLKSVLISS